MNPRDPLTLISQAKTIYEDLGADPQNAYAVIAIANLLQKDSLIIHAVMTIARFIMSVDRSSEKDA